MLFKGTDKYGSLDWSKEKVELEKLTHYTNSIILLKTKFKEKPSIKNRSVSELLQNMQLQMSTTNDVAMKPQRTNAFTKVLNKRFIQMMFPSASLDKYLAVQAEDSEIQF